MSWDPSSFHFTHEIKLMEHFHQVVTIQINISVNELHQQHQHQERRCPRPSSCYWRRFGQLKQTWRPRQSWSGGSQGSSCLVLCWLLEGRCKPGKEGPGGDGGESPVLTQSKAEPVMFFPESLIVRALHSFYARMEALVAKFTGGVMGGK